MKIITTKKKPKLEINNILVTLDASPASFMALEMAAEIAGIFKASLAGVYIEDEDLLSIASLPFSQESRIHGGLQPLDKGGLELEMQLLSAGLEKALKTQAERRKVAWQFRNIRGRVTEELVRAAREVDMISMAVAEWAASQRLVFKALPTLPASDSASDSDSDSDSASECVQLLYPSQLNCGHSIVVVLDDVHQRVPLLESAMVFSEQSQRPLMIVLSGARSGEKALTACVQQALAQFSLPEGSKVLSMNAGEALVDTLARHRPWLVLMGKEGVSVKKTDVCLMVEIIKAPLFLL